MVAGSTPQLRSLLLVIDGAGLLHVLGIDWENNVFDAWIQNSHGAWSAGAGQLNTGSMGPDTPFISISAAVDSAGNLQLAGVSEAGVPQIITYLDDGEWQAGTVFDSSTSCTAVVLTRGNNNYLQLVVMNGDGTVTPLMYLHKPPDDWFPI